MTVARAGATTDAAQKQHVDLFRKLLLRRELLPLAPPASAVYAPYIGDGDIAAELYADRLVLGADLDPERVATAGARLAGSDVRVADCEGPYPFADRGEPVGLADVDSYSNPYLALVAFWRDAPKAERVVVFGTDGMRMAIRVSRSKTLPALPASQPLGAGTFAERRHQYNSWWSGYVLPFIERTVAPWLVVDSRHYMRNHMDYWGVVVEPPHGRPSRAPRAPTPADTPSDTSDTEEGTPAALGADPVAKVEAALQEAALSGNVPAALAWLEANAPERWGERQTARMTPKQMAAALGYEDDPPG